MNISVKKAKAGTCRVLLLQSVLQIPCTLRLCTFF